MMFRNSASMPNCHPNDSAGWVESYEWWVLILAHCFTVKTISVVKYILNIPPSYDRSY